MDPNPHHEPQPEVDPTYWTSRLVKCCLIPASCSVSDSTDKSAAAFEVFLVFVARLAEMDLAVDDTRQHMQAFRIELCFR